MAQCTDCAQNLEFCSIAAKVASRRRGIKISVKDGTGEDGEVRLIEGRVDGVRSDDDATDSSSEFGSPSVCDTRLYAFE